MKMKELNFWLSFAGFLQLIVLGCAGAFVNEMVKEDRSFGLLIASLILGTIVLCVGIAIYLNVYNDISKRR